MAKKIYGVDSSGNRQWIKEIYGADSSGNRKLIKKVYGVDSSGNRKLCYNHIDFTTSSNYPFPVWDSSAGTTTTANTQYTASNSWGNWIIQSDKAAYSTATVAWKAMDSSDTSYHRPSSSSATMWWTVSLPSGLYIKPTGATLIIDDCTNASNIQGYNPRTSTWETLYTVDANTSSKTTKTITFSTKNYYSMFGVKLIPYNSVVAKLYDFKITSGTIADEQ